MSCHKLKALILIRGPLFTSLFFCLLIQGSSGFDLSEWLGFNPTDNFLTSSEKPVSQNEVSHNELLQKMSQNELSQKVLNNQMSQRVSPVQTEILLTAPLKPTATLDPWQQSDRWTFKEVSQINWTPNGAQLSRYEIPPIAIDELSSTKRIDNIELLTKSDELSKTELSSVELSPPQRDSVTINPLAYVVVTNSINIFRLVNETNFRNLKYLLNIVTYGHFINL